MSAALILPLAVALACGTAATWVPWPFRPMVTVRIISAIAVATAASTGVVLVALAAGFVARSPGVEWLLESCPVVPVHHRVSVIEGLGAVLLLSLGAVNARRTLRRRRWAAEGTAGRSFSVLETDEPIAYAAPGDPGCVVISRGLLDSLGRRERQVVVAHERAHLHHRHHRYLLAGEMSAGLVPLLRPLVRRLRLATERSADEAAVAAVGGDRRLVARTIARAALSRTAHAATVPGFGGASVGARVEALTRPEATAAPLAFVLAGAVTTLVTLTAGTVQIHHIAELVDHLCHL